MLFFPLAVPEENKDAEDTTSWTPGSRRTGLIGIKLGMTQMWNSMGRIVPITLIKVRDRVSRTGVIVTVCVVTRWLRTMWFR